MRARGTAALILIVSLSGCVRLIPPGVAGDAMRVTVSNTWGTEESWPLAVEHCRIYGKIPKARPGEFAFSKSYDCVTTDQLRSPRDGAPAAELL